MRKIWNYLNPYKFKMAFGLSIKFLGTIMDLFLPWILAYLIDTIVPMKNLNFVFLWGGMMIVCAILALVFNVMANRMASAIAGECVEEIRHDLFERVFSLSGSQIDEFTVPSLESRLTNDTYSIHQMIGMMQRLGVRAPILLLGGLIVTFMMEPVLTLSLLGVLPLILIVVYGISKTTIPLYLNLQQSVDNMTHNVRESISGIRVIKALSKMVYEKERFDNSNKNVVKEETKAATITSMSSPLMSLFLNVGLTIVVIAGAFRVDSGTTDVGKIIAFLSYFTIILNAMLSITRMFMIMSKGTASASRISQVLETENDFIIYPSDKIKTDNHISFKHVSFSYNKEINNVTDIDFGLKKGQVLGIIGPTGCGKSTIINLLIRFYDTDEGEIRIDGQNVNSIPFDKLYKMFGIVFQNDVIFGDTIEENISFGRSISKKKLIEAARHAQALDFIEKTTGGFNYHISAKGTNLSGGQKQRILLSRALVNNPKILILDDSSSALDYQTDAKLRSAIKKYYKNTTTIVITQRASSIAHADQILVMEEGKVIGQGKHQDLLVSCAMYRDIYDSQMGGIVQ